MLVFYFGLASLIEGINQSELFLPIKDTQDSLM